MKLFIITGDHRGSVFGIGTYIQELLFSLRKYQLNICVVHLFSEQTEMQIVEQEGVQNWYIPAPRIEYRAADDGAIGNDYLKNVVYLFRAHIEDTDQIVFHLNYHYAGFAHQLHEAFRCKVIVVAHYSIWSFSIFDNIPYLHRIISDNLSDPLSNSVRSAWSAECACYAQADRVVCLSAYMRNLLHAEAGLSTEKLIVIPNGLHDTNGQSVDKARLRQKWLMRPDERLLLFAGRIDDVKGVRYLIRAFKQILRKYPESRLLLVGNGEFDTYLAEAREAAFRVSFTGILDRESLYELYHIADVGIVPSLFEPFGYVPLEMMMHGLPVVATATSGLNEVVDENCGAKVPLLVSADRVEIDTSLLAEKIIELLEHPAEARRAGEYGRKRYLRNFSSASFGDKMMSFYQSLFE